MAGLNKTITIQSGKYRPCTIKGKKALFHRWTEKEQVILENNRVFFKHPYLYNIRDEYEKTKIVPSGFTAVKLGGTYAIVEFENGSVALVDPRELTFLDSGDVFHENYIFFREENRL